MRNVWIIAQNEISTGPSGVTSQPVGTQEQSANTQVPGDPNAPARSARRSPFGYQQLLFLGLMFVIMYLFLFRGPRKRQQEHKQMVQTLEKNDKVRTIGGIMGTVMEVKGDEVVLKVDEANNTKIRVISSAIGKNLSKEKA